MDMKSTEVKTRRGRIRNVIFREPIIHNLLTELEEKQLQLHGQAKGINRIGIQEEHWN
jgi:hypothetical protein